MILVPFHRKPAYPNLLKRIHGLECQILFNIKEHGIYYLRNHLNLQKKSFNRLFA